MTPIQVPNLTLPHPSLPLSLSPPSLPLSLSPPSTSLPPSLPNPNVTLSSRLAVGVYLSDGLLNATVVRDDDDVDVDDASDVLATSTSAQGLVPAPAPGQGLGFGFPPEAVLYEVLEYGNARVQSGATFFATPGTYTLRAKFEPWEESWRPFDVMGERGLQSTLNYLPASKLVKIKIVPEKPVPVLLQVDLKTQTPSPLSSFSSSFPSTSSSTSSCN